MNIKTSNVELIAPCGIDCGACPIRRAPFDSDAAEELVSWFKGNKWLEEEEGINEIISKGMYCKGCRSDRKALHWSPDCQILECCVYEKELDYCYECSEFVCERLEEWAEENSGHKKALKRLKRLKKKS